jgi:hypothetical protein
LTGAKDDFATGVRAGASAEAMTSSEWMRRIEQQKSAMLATVSAWPAELQALHPTNGGWSALEVLDHLVRVEVGISAEVAKGLAQPQRLGIRDRVGFVFVERVFLSRRRVKVPQAVKELVLPGRDLGLGEIAARWERTRADLARLGREVEASGCRGGVFRHPVSGWMSFERVLRFLSAHMVHHGYQLERIGAAVGATSR